MNAYSDPKQKMEEPQTAVLLLFGLISVAYDGCVGMTVSLYTYSPPV